jgi:hypothetical protein
MNAYNRALLHAIRTGKIVQLEFDLLYYVLSRQDILY